MAKIRLDKYISEKSGFSREYSKEAIDKGKISVNGKIILKPSYPVSENDLVDIKEDRMPYVSRGGFKLEKALREFHIVLSGKTAVDAGASTGGFTDCMLINGIAKVYAVDTGSSQLSEKLLSDERVSAYEKTDIRSFGAEFSELADFICADVSFISLSKIISDVSSLLKPKGEAVLLVKPQFETDGKYLNKQGVVKNPKAHLEVILRVMEICAGHGLHTHGLTFSPITGRNGNIEYLLYLMKGRGEMDLGINAVKNIIKAAFESLD